VDGTQRPSIRRWLVAARHPALRDGMIALALFLLPWAVASAFALRHRHLDSGAVGILATASLGLPALWLAWAGYRVASGPSPANRGAGPGTITAGPGSVVAGHGGTAIGQVVLQPRQGVMGKPVRLAEPPPLLAGREELLADLDARLAAGDGPTPRIIALCGFGGIGKTSVVAAYARRHLTEVGLAWQFAAYDPTVLEAEFGELASQLDARDIAGTRDPVASVHGVLAAFSAEWLLVFDNVQERASVERFLPPAGPGQVLITSQNPNWPHGQALEVPPLGAGAAADFLVTRTRDPDRQAAQELASELGGLPLALEQAAAYILATGGTLARYLELFKERRPDMLSRGEPTGYSGTVATTWALAFAQLEESAPSAVGLLRLLAFCAPEAVPLYLLVPRPELVGQLGAEVAPVLMPLLEDELAVTDAVAALRRYSLVTPAADGLTLVHRLVQAVTADQMPPALAGAWRQAAAAVIAAAVPEDPRQPENWPACAALLPHVQIAVAADSDAMARMADYLASLGSYAAARELQHKVAAARERVLGLEDPRTLDAQGDLANFAGLAGDMAGARDQFAKLVPIWERLRGPDDPGTLATRGNLAEWTGEAGDAAGARDQCAALVPVTERVSGLEHPNTLAARGNLAAWTGEAGDPAGARDQYAALVPMTEQVLGPEHPHTLTARESLGYWTAKAGDTAMGRREYAAVLAIRERLLGPEHPDTLNSRISLAAFSADAGDVAGPGTSTPRYCPTWRGCSALSTRAPWPSAAMPPT
jgi:hypothetical protein